MEENRRIIAPIAAQRWTEAHMRLIDADKLYEKFIDGESDTEQEKSANQLARYLIRHEPTVDTAPVVHGKWIGYDASYWRYSHSGAYPVNRRRFKCSVCGRTAPKKEPYCHCGARMDL